MNPTLIAAIPGAIAAVMASLSLWRSSGHNRAAAEQTSLVTFNQQLLEEREQLFDRLGHVAGNVDAVQRQVTNQHDTNLRDDLTSALTQLSLVTTVLKDVPNRGDFRRLRADVRADISQIREQVDSLEARVTARDKGIDL